MRSSTEKRLSKLESRRRESRLEDMTVQEVNARIGALEKLLGGRQEILTELGARVDQDSSALRFISLLEQREEIAT